MDPTVTFSGQPKPLCFLCYSPYHSQLDCPIADPARHPSRGPTTSLRTCQVPHSAAAAASRLTGHAMPPRPIGRRCQDSARQRPRREINCFSSLALSNPFSDFSVVANSHTKRFSFIVLDLTYLLTYWMCVICSQSGFRATASCYTSVL